MSEHADAVLVLTYHNTNTNEMNSSEELSKRARENSLKHESVMHDRIRNKTLA
jgi:hypothetical protein